MIQSLQSCKMLVIKIEYKTLRSTATTAHPVFSLPILVLSFILKYQIGVQKSCLLQMMDNFFRYLSTFNIGFLFLLSSFSFTSKEASNPLDQNGNITIIWDLVIWTPDGYVGVVTIRNLQHNRRIRAPGWTLGWTWARNEVIWTTLGSRTRKQGDCSRFKGNIPQSCEKNPRVNDLSPGAPFNQQVAKCCKGGVINSNSASSFQLSVGNAGNTNKTVRLPKNFVFKAPGDGYTCGPAKIVKPTRFISADKRRVTQALMTWNVICKHIMAVNL